MAHPRTGVHHLCLHAADGVCLTFGPSCAPADGCYYDPTARGYRTCARPLVGRCAEAGAACAPRDRCRVDPDAGRYRACEAEAGGVCARFGAPCEPGGAAVSAGSGRANQSDHSAPAAAASSALGRSVSAR